MKPSIQFWLSCGIALCTLATSSPTTAQIVPDASLPVNSSVTLEGNTSTINGGTRAGSNLFHSFEQFSVPTGSAAYFNNTLNIQNIISRVTGSSISNIDGLIQANGTANLFLLNPNGIIFGPNASLNIGGSFLASTASSLNFADGTQFSATAPQATPLLTISVPIGLQFGENPRGVLVQGQGQGIRTTSALIDTSVGLRVQPNQTLALVGGDVALSGGTLKTAGGRIELGSVAGSSLVSLTSIDKGWTLGYSGVQNFRDIQLSQQAAVDASGAGGGDIQVQSRRVTLTDGSRIEASTLGSEPGGMLAVTAFESVELIGESADRGFPSALAASVYQGATGAGGSLTLETGRLLVRDGAVVSTNTSGTGHGGTLSVTASDAVELIGTSAGGRFGGSGLYTQTESAGNAGNLRIATSRLLVRDGAQVSTGTFNTGAGGTLSVTASDAVELIGGSAGNHFSSGLFTQTGGATYAGDGVGNAGDLTIATRRLLVRDGAEVSAITLGTGAGGTLSVTASDAVELIGESADGQLSGLFAQTFGAGDARDLRIDTGRLTVRDGAKVTVSSEGSGNAGNLEVAANSIRLENKASLSSDTIAGQGNIILRSGDLVLRCGSNITTNATGTATGGNITIDSGVIVALEDSDISANASEGPGGRVIINAQGIFGTQFRNQLTPLSDITATSELGPQFSGTVEINTPDVATFELGPQFSGTVEINTPDVDTRLGLATLPAELVEASTLIATGCAAVGENEFKVTGRGGLPPNPGEPLSSDVVWEDNRLPATTVNQHHSGTVTAPQPSPSAAIPIVPATGWVFNDKGEVTLTAQAPTASPHIPWMTPTTCHAPKTAF